MSAGHPSRWFFRLCIVALFSGAVMASILVDLIVNSPSTPDVLNWFSFWTILMFCSAVSAIVVFLASRNAYNPEVTFVRNGASLIGVGLSAFAFNLPPWRTGIEWLPLWSTALGWFLIALTLVALEPIWKNEAAAAADAKELARSRKEIASLKAEIEQLRSKSRKSLTHQIRHLVEKVGQKVKELLP